MKKSTLEALYNLVNGRGTVTNELREEVNAEYERTTAKARANHDAYKAAEQVVMSVLTDTPMTAKEVFAASDEWPDGFTANKVQYGLNNYWKDSVKRHDNGKNPYTYTRNED